MDFERCFIMLCNTLTEQEFIDRNLFGDKAKRLDCLTGPDRYGNGCFIL
ncbi:MAG: hypothetical protein H8D67_06790 [Deltaproteobacteria bacterium]|nr:hypothetical protein [Deltaproteobacteria bacterium]